jgi:hypothetical protein
MLASYLSKIPGNVLDALNKAYELNTEPALTLANYINQLPKEVNQSRLNILKRSL